MSWFTISLDKQTDTVYGYVENKSTLAETLIKPLGRVAHNWQKDYEYVSGSCGTPSSTLSNMGC